MVMHKTYKSYGIISRIRNTSDIKSKNDLLHSLTPMITTVSMSGPLPIEQICKPYVQPKRGYCIHSLLPFSSRIGEIDKATSFIDTWPAF